MVLENALEKELDGELHLAGITQRAGDLAERSRIRHNPRRESPVHPVEQVEGLDVELQSPRVEQDGAEHCEVHRLRARTADTVRATVAVREQRRNRERGGVEPRIDRLVET